MKSAVIQLGGEDQKMIRLDNEVYLPSQPMEDTIYIVKDEHDCDPLVFRAIFKTEIEAQTYVFRTKQSNIYVERYIFDQIEYSDESDTESITEDESV